MAIVLVDIVYRDMEFSDICFDDFYRGERANELRLSRHYQVGLDLIRTMVKNHDERGEKANGEASNDSNVPLTSLA